MLPHVGTRCKFALTTKFASLDGVYEVVSLGSFDDLIASGVDFVAKLYTPAGLAQADYIADYATYVGGVVCQVSPVSDSSTTYYFPEAILQLVPDPTVQKYQKVYIAALLGEFQDTSKYLWLKGEIDALISSVTGTTNQTRFMANPDNDVWLTQEEYDVIDAARKANIQAVNPIYLQLQNALALNTALQARVAALESAIIASGGIAQG